MTRKTGIEKSSGRKKAEKASRTVAVFSPDNEQVGQKALSPEVFGACVNEHLLYEAVKRHRAGARRGTHMTKNRALVSGTGKKPWRQKGTGRARVGETRNPLWRHGGTVFGPTPRDYGFRPPRSARFASLRSALSLKAAEGALKVVRGFHLNAPKTRELKAALTKLGVSGKTLLVDVPGNDVVFFAGRNMVGVRVVDSSHVSVYDVLDCRTLIVSQEALESLEERLTP
jgi:large subunit ribosomal protein L4